MRGSSTLRRYENELIGELCCSWNVVFREPGAKLVSSAEADREVY